MSWVSDFLDKVPLISKAVKDDMDSIDEHGNAEYPDVGCDTSATCRWDWVTSRVGDADAIFDSDGRLRAGELGHYELTNYKCGRARVDHPVGPHNSRCYCAQMPCDGRLLRYGFHSQSSTHPYDHPANGDCYDQWVNPNREGGALVIKSVNTVSGLEDRGASGGEPADDPSITVISSITFACTDSLANQPPADQPTPGIKGACCKSDGSCVDDLSQYNCNQFPGSAWWIAQTCNTVNNGNGCTPSAPQPPSSPTYPRSK